MFVRDGAERGNKLLRGFFRIRRSPIVCMFFSLPSRPDPPLRSEAFLTAFIHPFSFALGSCGAPHTRDLTETKNLVTNGARMVDLQSLASDTTVRLAAIWDELGVPKEERDTYINRIAEDVAELYHSRVQCQQQRKADVLAEIASLSSTIDNMHHAMKESAAVPAQGGKSLLEHRDSLERYRADLQAVSCVHQVVVLARAFSFRVMAASTSRI